MTRKALIQLGQHRSALQRVERRHLLKGCLSLGALTMLTGCNLRCGRSGLMGDVTLERPRAGLALCLQQAGAYLPGQRNHQAVSIQRLLYGG